MLTRAALSGPAIKDAFPLSRFTTRSPGTGGTHTIVKILIADDDLVSSKVLTLSLTRLDHEVISAANGQEALAAFQVHRPPIIISDWMMPKMDGIDLCQAIRKLRLTQYTFFILLTSKSRHPEYLQAMGAGVDDFLRKPLNVEELIIRLRVAERILEQRREAERQLELLARFSSDNPNPVLQIDPRFRIQFANAASLEVLTQWSSKVGDSAPEKLRELAEAILSTGKRHELELVCGERVYSFSATSVSPDGVAYLYGHDISERKRAENELMLVKNQAEHNALHDQLTGLPNRRLLTERLNHETERALRLKQKLALLIVDIDHFKQINDSHGHKVGDQMIITVGQCLQENLRSSDTVCRWGGDELVVLLTDVHLPAAVEAVCMKLQCAVKKRAVEAGFGFPVTLSIGSAIFPDDAADAVLLMQQADHALYSAKSDGRDRWRRFDGFSEKHDSAFAGRADLLLRLKGAVENGRIIAYYQPIVDTVTGEVLAAEVLARWEDAEHGWVAPDIFIPLAEENGLITKLGDQVLMQALEQLCRWRRSGHPLTLSFNLSKQQILEDGFGPRLLEQLKRLRLDPGWITLEVIERQSVLAHPLGRQRLKRLAAAGFQLAVDDFGAGYSSFELIDAVPFDELKIHMGLVRRVNDPKGRGIVRAVVDMGKTLGHRLVAEGVETEDTRAILWEMGVHRLQGYLFSKALPADKFLEYLDSRQSLNVIRQAA